MNWEAIGAIGEVIGAAGVIASLVYLAVQIRHNTRSHEAATYQSVAEGLADASYRMIDAPTTPLDRVCLFVGTIRRYENLHFQVRKGNLLFSDVEGFINSLGTYLYVADEDGFQALEFWPGARSLFHPEFVAFVEGEIIPRGDEFIRVGRRVLEPPVEVR